MTVLLIGLLFLVTGCGTLSTRVVSDPAEAVARLQAKGSVDAEVDRLAQPIIDSGEIYVEGVNLATMSDNKKTEHRARRMGFVFQFYNLLPVLSAVENVELPLLVSGVRAKEARRQAVQALEVVHLVPWADHKPAELSGGQRQRVTIARALVNEPAIVWGDEPTGDLDSQNATEIMDLLTDLNERHHQTFVLVTHDHGVARRAGRLIRMQDGQIIGDEPIAREPTAGAPARTAPGS
ncbi:MAG: ABC transporter ATP-binding protein [Dehalococcoidia bacterium]|nr:ABC transporter ATP-binding protein [Dehalococcoidia bacterium]